MTQPIPLLLETSQLTHCYGEVTALDRVNLRLGQGTIGLVGRNGAGKSTLLQILLGLIRPTRGSCRIHGNDMDQDVLALRGRIGYMPERNAVIAGMKGVEYVALAGELAGMNRRDALRRAHETLSYLRLDEARYRLVEQYSVGMTQRLKLAAALVHDPELLLLDEPTSGLDPEGRKAMVAVLREIGQQTGKSLILSTHILSDIEEVCRQVVILEAGRVLCQKPTAALKRSRPSLVKLTTNSAVSERFQNALQQLGAVTTSVSANELLVETPRKWSNLRFFEVADRHALRLTAISSQHENLDEAYRRLVENLSESQSQEPASGAAAALPHSQTGQRSEASAAVDDESDSALAPPEKVPRRLGGYRGWEGVKVSPHRSVWSIARSGAKLVFRRKLLWVLIGIALINFAYHFSQIYLKSQLASSAQFGPMGRFAARAMNSVVSGRGDFYRQFIFSQGSITMVLLVFAGGLLVGNDFFRSALSFYLARRIHRTHYFLGKISTIALLVSIVTTIPCLVLFVGYGALTESMAYYWENPRILAGILGYGLTIALVLSTLLFALASWIQKTVPLVMAWAGVFVFLPAVGILLRQIFDDRRWLALLLWQDVRYIGDSFFGSVAEQNWEQMGILPFVVVAVVLVVSTLCAIPRLRIQSVVD